MNEKYEYKISDKVAARVADLAERLYEYIPDVCWMTEVNLAKALGVAPRQIKYAKSYLESVGKIRIELRENGKRKNPVHTLIKVNPINQVYSDVSLGEINNRIDWSLFNKLSARDFNDLSVEDKLEFYEQMRLQFIPLHFPKFDKKGQPFCSCRYGHNCESIGKHPATAYKSLDFSSSQTYKAMKAYWQKDARYNIGFVVDGFTVIDVDYRKGGAYGLESLEEAYGELPRNLTVKTGGGLHIYALGNCRIKNGVDVLGYRGIDIKSKGGLIVAPFSDHYSGNSYEWLSVSEPKRLPQELIDDLQDGKNRSDESRATGTGNKKTSTLPKDYDTNFRIEDGARGDILFKLACRERGKGANYPELIRFLRQINSNHCQPPVRERKLEFIADSVIKYPTNREKMLR